ncbi:FAD-dependent pyridine nucleotide-disulphide oxidoreductase [Methanococcus vannielii SB]|uniref:FAD-dependent pyridine nucleotide-disulphide oxidoreductase n=1 Tax=Methanococcus vannielii (strain ATCC 35089 / DSM 1224 / JCM 13029 / OCM 148 / SB) TaxID=406327 RepID=A6UPX7_METVS|nr:FAD-dependent oxidoreductase [Methanococcus vannielii]ABR54549.1 FAD-dependent pyridine nucleotide-disulphide oxidoreductase [Methanococcus vannielii SB]
MIAVVGAGPAGLSCASMLSKFGLSVELFERDKLGGTCLNYGCRYINALKDVSDTIESLNSIKGKKHTLNDILSLSDLHNKIDNIHEVMRENSLESLTKKGIVVKFKEFKEEYEKDYDYVVYATGYDYPTSFEGVECAKYNEIPYIRKLPKKVLVIGGGTVAAEYASIFSTFGSDVTVYVRSKFLKMIEDDEVREYIINNISNFKITSDINVMRKMLNDNEYFNVLAVGGTPKYKTNEFLQVDGKNNVYACGDAVKGGYTPIANREGKLVAENIYNAIKGIPLKKMTYGINISTIRMPMNISVLGKQTLNFKTTYNRPGSGYYFKKSEKRGMNRIYYENGKVVGAIAMTPATDVSPYFLQYIKGIDVYNEFLEVYPSNDPFYWQV